MLVVALCLLPAAVYSSDFLTVLRFEKYLGRVVPGAQNKY